ncbi:MAG: hypothetical protein ACYT04_82145, partial [Nostoc sp.]
FLFGSPFAFLTLVFILTDVHPSLILISTIIAVMSTFLSYKSNDIKQLFLSSIPNRGLPLVNLYGSNAKK